MIFRFPLRAWEAWEVHFDTYYDCFCATVAGLLDLVGILFGYFEVYLVKSETRIGKTVFSVV